MNGAHLASVHSDEEGQFLSTLMSNVLSTSGGWIGLERTGTSFQWSDGSVLDYLSWNAGEPNNANEKCVHQFYQPGNSRHKKWNDLNCGALISFICKKSTPGN